MHLKASSPPSRKKTTRVRLELKFVLPSDDSVGFQINTSVYRCVYVVVCVCVVGVSAETYIYLSVYGHCVTTNLDLKVDLKDFWSSVRWNLKCPSMTVSAVIYIFRMRFWGINICTADTPKHYTYALTRA